MQIVMCPLGCLTTTQELHLLELSRGEYAQRNCSGPVETKNFDLLSTQHLTKH
jgi:hypothetical protein